VALPEDAGLYRTGDVLRACSLPNLPRCWQRPTSAWRCCARAQTRVAARLHRLALQHPPAGRTAGPRLVRGEDLRLPAPDGWTVVSHADEALGLV
jgi:hypothetical protein